MKKRFLTLLALPFLLTCCGDKGLRGIVNGEKYDEAKRSEVVNVDSVTKDEILSTTSNKISIKGKTFVKILLSNKESSFSIETNQTYDISVTRDNPAIEVATSGSLYTKIGGFSVRASINGHARAHEEGDEWIIDSDVQTIVSSGGEQEQKTFFNNSVVYAGEYFAKLIDVLFSWNYELSSSQLDFTNIETYLESPTGIVGELLEIFAINGNIEEGTFEIGISKPLYFADNKGVINKLRVAYENYLIKEHVFRVEYSNRDQDTYLNLITETSFQYSYN